MTHFERFFYFSLPSVTGYLKIFPYISVVLILWHLDHVHTCLVIMFFGYLSVLIFLLTSYTCFTVKISYPFPINKLSQNYLPISKLPFYILYNKYRICPQRDWVCYGVLSKVSIVQEFTILILETHGLLLTIIKML